MANVSLQVGRAYQRQKSDSLVRRMPEPVKQKKITSKPREQSAQPEIVRRGRTVKKVAAHVAPANDDKRANALLRRFAVFQGSMGGIEEWLTSRTPLSVRKRLLDVNKRPLTREQLNQLLLLAHEAGMAPGFFQYYWLHVPGRDEHPYDVRSIPGFKKTATDRERIKSLDQLYWGLYRLYVDALLFFGNVRNAYRFLRRLSFPDLQDFFGKRTFNFATIELRGPALPLHNISKDDRYLISEMACKSFEPADRGEDMVSHLSRQLLRLRKETGRRRYSIRELIDGIANTEHGARQTEFQFSANEFLEEFVETEEQLQDKYGLFKRRFDKSRDMAVRNTDLFLSMVNDLDVYVATSMRNRQDFRDMADFCESVFRDKNLAGINVRYFDPTVSAAPGHEDKGLIECLMVKSAKVLLYFAGERDSFGKDAETAMALSMGKPVVIYSKSLDRARLFRDIHPLTRLIDFQSGVAVGAMVTDNITVVPKLIYRVLSNTMEYELIQPKPDYLQLREKLTESIVRIQTNNKLLRETFWNHYHEPV